jgi:glutamate decarboxylase
MSLRDDVPYSVFDVSDRLRSKGWQVPAYTMPDDATDVAVLRVVIREGFSYDLADALLADLEEAIDHLQEAPPPAGTAAAGFSHT